MEAVGFPRGVSAVRLAAILKEKYPDHQLLPWNNIHLRKGKTNLQKGLERALTVIFPVRIPFDPFWPIYSICEI